MVTNIVHNIVNSTVRELYETENGGISFCLEILANCLANEGLDVVLRQLEEDCNAAESKRERDCLYFLIDGITGLDQKNLQQHIHSLQILQRDAQRLNDVYKEKTAAVDRAIEEWKKAATRFDQLLSEWKQSMFRDEKLRLGGFTEKTTLRITSPRRLNFFRSTPTVSGSIEKFKDNRRFFSRIIDIVNTEIENAHLANRLPPELDVREFYTAIKELEKRQLVYEQLTMDDVETNRQDDEIWDRYYQAVNALTQTLGQMKRVHLWSLFWLYHRHLMETAAC